MHRHLLCLAVLMAAGCSPGAGTHANQRGDAVLPPADSLPSRRTDVVRPPVETLPARVDVDLRTLNPALTGSAELDLSGAWATGSGAEPAERRIVFREQCNYSPARWVLEQRGDTVLQWLLPESRAQGIPAPIRASPVPVEGRLKGAQLVMGDRATRYRLRYDSASEHLRGTLNGAPFWAVRLDVIRATGCKAIP